MSMAVGSKLQLEPGSWEEVLYEVYIGVVVGVGHNVNMLYVNFVRPYLRMLGMATEEVVGSGEKTLKVVGVGYGRTGTVG